MVSGRRQLLQVVTTGSSSTVTTPGRIRGSATRSNVRSSPVPGAELRAGHRLIPPPEHRGAAVGQRIGFQPSEPAR